MGAGRHEECARGDLQFQMRACIVVGAEAQEDDDAEQHGEARAREINGPDGLVLVPDVSEKQS